MLKDRHGERQRQVWRLLFAVAALWTVWVSLAPVEALPDVSLWDKAAHALNYALLMLLLLPSMDVPRTTVAGSWIMLYGVVIEFAQAMTGYRNGDWHDAVANLIGILVAGLVWRLYRQWKQRAG